VGATFGRDTRDAIENQRLAPLDQRGLYRKPNVGGTLVHPASQLAHPPSNAALESVVQPAYKFKG
jgi:hypothetical protein